jgi:peptidyl-prolyl cis-trans isomerase SurA
MIPRLAMLVTVVTAVALAGVSGVAAERNVVDKVAVVVGDQVILTSELASQIQIAAFQSGRRPKTETEVKQFQEEILEQMISDQLFLIEAKKDTSISVRREEVEQALDEHIARVQSNFGSVEAFQQALETEGMTLRDLRKKYYTEIENNLLRQRFIQKKLYSVSVSRYEVEQFFQHYKDSIPDQPEAVELGHILLKVSPSQRIQDSVTALADTLRQRILDGADLAALSSQYSSFGAGANGGDLGYVNKEDVDPEFARAAFKLNDGEISGVIRTQFGCHIIRCEGRRGEQLHLRHLLLGVQPSTEDTARTLALADSLISEINGGADFAELAKVFSTDNDSRAQGGTLGWFAVGQLPPDFVSTVAGWKTPGEIRGPIRTQFGIHILKLLAYQPTKRLALDADYDRIKELARQDKTGRIVDNWIAEIKDKTYVDYRLDDLKQ